MNRNFLGGAALVALYSLAGTVHAQTNPRGKTKINLDGKLISIEYGQPSLHGRTVYEMLGKLPAGGWRMGADTATTFSTSGDLMFGEVKIPAGIYSLWARKDSDKTWKLVFNSQHGQSGTLHNPKLDVAEVAMKESRAADTPDEVEIKLTKGKKGGEIDVEWGDLRLYTNFN